MNTWLDLDATMVHADLRAAIMLNLRKTEARSQLQGETRSYLPAAPVAQRLPLSQTPISTLEESLYASAGWKNTGLEASHVGRCFSLQIVHLGVKTHAENPLHEEWRKIVTSNNHAYFLPSQAHIYEELV